LFFSFALETIGGQKQKSKIAVFLMLEAVTEIVSQLSGVSDQRHKCTKTLIKIQISVSLQPCNYFRKLAFCGIWSEHNNNCSKRNISWIDVEQQTNN
jgi:hypothetical protein